MQRLYGWSVPQNLSPWRFSCSSLALPSCQLCSSNMMSKPNNPSEGFLMFEDMRQTQAKQPTCTSFTSFIFLRCPVWHHKDQDNLMGQNEHLFDSFSRGADDANNTSTVNYAHVLAFSHSRHKAGPLSLTLWLCFVPHAFSSLCGQAWSKRAVQMPTFHVFFELHMMFSRRHWRHSSKHCHRVALLLLSGMEARQHQAEGDGADAFQSFDCSWCSLLDWNDFFGFAFFGKLLLELHRFSTGQTRGRIPSKPHCCN